MKNIFSFLPGLPGELYKPLKMTICKPISSHFLTEKMPEGKPQTPMRVPRDVNLTSRKISARTLLEHWSNLCHLSTLVKICLKIDSWIYSFWGLQLIFIASMTPFKIQFFVRKVHWFSFQGCQVKNIKAQNLDFWPISSQFLNMWAPEGAPQTTMRVIIDVYLTSRKKSARTLLDDCSN